MWCNDKIGLNWQHIKISILLKNPKILKKLGTKLSNFHFALTQGTWPLDQSLDATAKRQKEKFILIRLRSWYVAISQSYHSITWILYSAVYGGPSSSSLGSSLSVQSMCSTILQSSSNFSCRFLNPNYFFPIWILIVLTSRNNLKKHSVEIILMISKFLQILGLQPRRVFLDH